MRKRLFITGLLTVALQTSAMASQYSVITINPYNLATVVPNSYIRGVISQGEVVRWNPATFPLKVYIQTSGVPSDYIAQVKRAYMRWQSITDGTVKFTLVNSADDADMKCYFMNDLENVSDDTVGYHQFQYSGNYIADSVIKFRYTDKYGQKFTPGMIYTVALHEIGHALGLAGHSSNSGDLMYPVSKERKTDMSRRDLTTFKLLYMMKPDITNEDFSSAAEAKLLTKTQVAGGSQRLKQDAETAAKINSGITPGDPTSKWRLARAYKSNKKYSAAIKEYKEIIPLLDSSDMKSAVYCEMVECYIGMKNYTSAKNCAAFVQKKYPSQQTEVLLPKIQYANGEKQTAVKALVAIFNENQNPYAANMLKDIYKKEKNNTALMKIIQSQLKL